MANEKMHPLCRGSAYKLLQVGPLNNLSTCDIEDMGTRCLWQKTTRPGTRPGETGGAHLSSFMEKEGTFGVNNQIKQMDRWAREVTGSAEER